MVAWVIAVLLVTYTLGLCTASFQRFYGIFYLDLTDSTKYVCIIEGCDIEHNSGAILNGSLGGCYALGFWEGCGSNICILDAEDDPASFQKKHCGKKCERNNKNNIVCGLILLLPLHFTLLYLFDGYSSYIRWLTNAMSCHPVVQYIKISNTSTSSNTKMLLTLNSSILKFI